MSPPPPSAYVSRRRGTTQILDYTTGAPYKCASPVLSKDTLSADGEESVTVSDKVGHKAEPPITGSSRESYLRMLQQPMKMIHKRTSDTIKPKLRFEDDDEFNGFLLSIEKAIEKGIHPTLIPAGSSGSYFARNEQNKIVGVFKPKDEEPFAPLNPKWPKYLQRFFSPCCFGRKCLLSNHGYLSEVGASVIDEMLELNIVPKTRLVWLASPAFNYGSKSLDVLPMKVGSLQTFLEGYDSAGYWIRKFEKHQPELDEQQRQILRTMLQRMIVLDYIIRNTDRSDNNWMIRYKPDLEDSSAPNGALCVAAIDNGLAFPLKHPVQESRMRTFPFYWATLPDAQESFADELIVPLLAKLDNPLFVNSLVSELRPVFKQDSGFNNRHFRAQMKVMRGQIANLRESLRQRETPLALANRPPLLAIRTKHKTQNKHTDKETPLQSIKRSPLVVSVKQMVTAPCDTLSDMQHTQTDSVRHSAPEEVGGGFVMVGGDGTLRSVTVSGSHVVITTETPTKNELWEEHFRVEKVDKAPLCCCSCAIM